MDVSKPLIGVKFTKNKELMHKNQLCNGGHVLFVHCTLAIFSKLDGWMDGMAIMYCIPWVMGATEQKIT